MRADMRTRASIAGNLRETKDGEEATTVVTATTATEIMEAVAHGAAVIIEISGITVIERTSTERTLTVKTGETIETPIEITIAMSEEAITATQGGMRGIPEGAMLEKADETIAMEVERSL